MTAASASADQHALDLLNARAFHEQGFLGPITLCAPEEMAALRPAIEAALAREPSGSFHGGMGRIHNRHLDCPELLALTTRPKLVDQAAAILGPDVLIWRVHVFDKPPGALEIPWHQDLNYWPLEPAVLVSAWIAIDEATVENSCVQILPGSHRRMLPHVRSGPEMLFSEMADLTGVDLDAALDMELRPGQCFLFNERMLHHSEPNRSQRRRMGVAVRFMPPLVRVLNYDGDDHGVVVARGGDRLGFNRVVTPRSS